MSVINSKKAKKLLLTSTNVGKFWNEIDSEILAPTLQEMDKRESWVLNSDAAVAYHLRTMSNHIKEDRANDIFSKKENIDNIITLLAYINSSYAFRLLKWFDDNSGNLLLKLVTQAQINIVNFAMDSDFSTPSEVFMERMVAVKKLSLIGTIFNPQRTTAIDTLLKSVEAESYKK